MRNLQNPPALARFQKQNVVLRFSLLVKIEVPDMAFDAFAFAVVSE